MPAFTITSLTGSIPGTTQVTVSPDRAPETLQTHEVRLSLQDQLWSAMDPDGLLLSVSYQGPLSALRDAITALLS